MPAVSAHDAHARHPLFARLCDPLSRLMEREIAPYRDELLAGLRGRVLDLGTGNGINFAHYPRSVEQVVAVEPEPYLRAKAAEAADQSSVPTTVTNAIAGALPFDDESFDAAVCSLVLCSVPSQTDALAELRRVLRPGGELRYFEHVRSPAPRKARLQDTLDRSGVWPRLAGGCHCARDTRTAIQSSGFRIERQRRLDVGPHWLHANPYLLGRAPRTPRLTAGHRQPKVDDVESDHPATVEQLAALVQARTPEGSVDARLRAAVALGRELTDSADALIERFVVEARTAGLSWSEIGALFGTSKQAAQKRYGPAGTEPGQWPGRWTPAARAALEHASEQARELGHNYVGTEHLLLGLLAVREGLAALALADLGITRDSVLAQECLSRSGEPRVYECLGVAPRLKQALEHTGRVAGALGHRVANTEHQLAGILAVPDALAVEILGRHGVSADDARAALAARLEVDPEQLMVAQRRRRRLLVKPR